MCWGKSCGLQEDPRIFTMPPKIESARPVVCQGSKLWHKPPQRTFRRILHMDLSLTVNNTPRPPSLGASFKFHYNRCPNPRHQLHARAFPKIFGSKFVPPMLLQCVSIVSCVCCADCNDCRSGQVHVNTPHILHSRMT